MSSPRLRGPSSLFSAPQSSVASHWAWTCRLIPRKHLISVKSPSAGALEVCGPFLHRAHSEFHSHVQPPVPSSHRHHARCHVGASLPASRAVSQLGHEASPHSARAVLESHALFPGGAYPLMVTVVRLAVVPTRLQPMPVNILLVDC